MILSWPVLAVPVAMAGAAEVRLLGAGSLKDPLTAMFADYTRQYGTTFSATWGPSGVLRERLQAGEAFDVFASAALPHAQALTDAGVSGPSVLFARNALCAVAAPDVQVETASLLETMLRPEVRIGTSTPVADPAGDYTREMFRRGDALRPGAFETLSKKAQQVFGGPNTSAPVNGRPRLDAVLDDHLVDLVIIYCSSARPLVKARPSYRVVTLPSDLSVGPEYGLTLSRKAQPEAAGFAMYLLSPQGQQTLTSFGFVPVSLPATP